MKKTKLTRSLLAACSIVALSAVMYGCTGDGSENDLVATQEALDQEREAHATTQAALDTANGEVTRLSTTLGAEMDPDPDSVRGMLAAATARIGAADDPGSLLGMLDAEQKEAMRLSTLVGELETELGDPTTPDPASVRGRLNAANDSLDAANTRIGSVDDPTSLMGMLDAEQKKAEMYRVAIEGDDTDANPGLQAELDAAKQRIAALEAGTASDILDPIKMAASDAATAAGTASTAAGTAADAAEAAIVGRAMYQTGEANSDDHAKDARTQADTAATESGNAMTASGLAQAATNANDARPHRDDAEDAQEAAETAQGMAEEQRDMAMADAMEEVFVDGLTKSVGGKSVTFEGGTKYVVTDGDTVLTGKERDILDWSDLVGEVLPVSDDEGTPDKDETVIAKPAIALRLITLGHVYDSDEDDARVALIHSYIGTRSVNAFFEDTSAVDLADVDGAGVDHDNSDTTDPLRVRAASGTFVMTETAIDVGGTIPATADEDGISLYFYVDRKDSADTTDDETTYLRRESTSTAADGTVTHNYKEVEVVRGVAGFPDAAEFDHFHFGVWSGLEEANKAGEERARWSRYRFPHGPRRWRDDPGR